MTRSRESFTRVDTAWLRMEDPTNLMVASGMMLFEHPVDFETLKAVVDRRLAAFPRFRMRALEAPLGIGTPVWEVDEHFDINSHIHRVALPAPGGQAELAAMVGDLVSTPLDFTKPPWQVHVIEGVDGGTALVSRIHHAIADGIALMHVLWGLTDATPNASVTLPGPTNETAAGHAGESPLVLRAAGSLLHPRRVLDTVGAVISGAQATMRLTVSASDSPSVLRGELGVAKHTAWSDRHSLADLKEVSGLLNSTLNDVVTAAVAGGLGAYMGSRGEDLDRVLLRAAVPVNLRAGRAADGLGNDFGLVFLELPVKPQTPLSRVSAVRRAMVDARQSHEADAALLLLGAFGMLPARMQPLAIDFFGKKASLTLTNVPGSPTHRYLAGQRISDVMFWGPESGRMALGVSVMTYAGSLRLGVISDAGLIPDPERLLHLIEAELRRLRFDALAKARRTRAKAGAAKRRRSRSVSGGATPRRRRVAAAAT